MLNLLVHPDLDDRDVRLLLLADELQRTSNKMTFRNLGDAIGVSESTVSKRFSRLRSLGVLSSKRMGSHQWGHTVHLLEESRKAAAPVGLLRSEPVTPPPILTQHPGDASPQIALSFIKQSLDHTKINSEPNLYIRGKNTIMTKTKPALPLADVIRASQEKTKVAHEEQMEKRKAKLLADKNDFYQTAGSKKRMEHDLKDEAIYTVHDMEYLFRDEWKKAGLKGTPRKWAGKDVRAMALMIKDQTPEVVAGYIQYVFANWDAIVARYAKVLSYPNAALICAYSSSWIPEWQNGPKGTPAKKAWGAEYSHCEYAEDDPWGKNPIPVSKPGISAELPPQGGSVRVTYADDDPWGANPIYVTETGSDEPSES